MMMMIGVKQKMCWEKLVSHSPMRRHLTWPLCMCLMSLLGGSRKRQIKLLFHGSMLKWAVLDAFQRRLGFILSSYIPTNFAPKPQVTAPFCRSSGTRSRASRMNMDVGVDDEKEEEGTLGNRSSSEHHVTCRIRRTHLCSEVWYHWCKGGILPSFHQYSPGSHPQRSINKDAIDELAFEIARNEGLHLTKIQMCRVLKKVGYF